MVAQRRALWAVCSALMLLAASAALPAAEAGEKAKKAHVNKKVPAVSTTPASGTTDDDTGTSGLQVNPTSGSTKSVTLKNTITDGNGHNDLASVNMTVYKSDNTTVHVALGSATKETGTSTSSTWARTFSMDYHDDPGTYYMKVEAKDRDGDTHTVWITFTYNTLVALTLSTSTVKLNAGGGTAGVSPGTDTHSNATSVTVTNSGNAVMDLQLSGTNLTNSTNAFAITNVHYSWESGMGNETGLTTSATTNSTFNLAKGASSTKAVYFAVHVPSGIRPGIYTGTMTLTAVSNQ